MKLETNTHYERAVRAYHQGRYRESADEYWNAFRSIADKFEEHRYYILRGYTSELRTNESLRATERDFDNVRTIFEDKKELRLYRMEAGLTLAILHNNRFETTKCEEIWEHVILIGERKPKKKRDAKVEETCMLVCTSDDNKSIENGSMKKLMQRLLNDCKTTVLEKIGDTPVGGIDRLEREAHLSLKMRCASY
jgi:hypothetical protein